jgi:hypothetical protein
MAFEKSVWLARDEDGEHMLAPSAMAQEYDAIIFGSLSLWCAHGSGESSG